MSALHVLPPLPGWVHAVLWLVVFAAAVRLAWWAGTAPTVAAAMRRHPAGRHRAGKEQP